MKLPQAKSRTSGGFTLIELLAAITIFALFSVMAYGGLSAVLKARTRVTESLDRMAQFQKAIYRLESDIEQARARPIRNEYGDTEPAFLVTDEDLVEFTRGGARNPMLQARSSFERVAYGLKDKRLVRYNWTTLDRGRSGQIVELPLLDRVKSLEWRFMDSSHEWRTTWPASGGNTTNKNTSLPLAVDMRLETEDWGEIHYLFRIVATPVTPDVGS